MGYRAVFLDGVVFLLWAFACSVSFRNYGFNLLLGSFGVVFGLVYGGVITLRQLKIIEKNGELRATRKMWAFVLLAIIDIVPLVVYFAFSFGLAVWERQMVSFAFLIVAATHATQTGLFLNWERKQKKHILYEGFLSGRVYASPEIEKR
jgi:Ca2+/Na+ antiporter